MRALLITAVLLTAGVALLPEASAACEPNPVMGDFCPGTYTERIRDRLDDPIEAPACEDAEQFPFC